MLNGLAEGDRELIVDRTVISRDSADVDSNDLRLPAILADEITRNAIDREIYGSAVRGVQTISERGQIEMYGPH